MALDPNIGRIKFLRSKTAGLTPTTADIDEGELALNLVDRTIYTRNGNNIIDMGFGKGGQVNGNITASGTVKATNLEGPLTGNAGSATILQTARTFTWSGDATGSLSFNGSANVAAALTLVNNGVTAGTYGDNINVPRFTVDAKGRVTSIINTALRTATTAQTGIVQLNDTLTSTSTTLALTANQGKVLKDSLDASNNNTATLLNTKVDKKVLMDGAAYKLYNVASLRRHVQTITGSIVIHFPTTWHKSATMLTMKLTGFNYVGNQSFFELNLGGYIFSTNWVNLTSIINGRLPNNTTSIKWAYAVDHPVIIIGAENSTWNYPFLMIDELMTNNRNTELDQFSINFETDLTPYTLVQSSEIFGTTRSTNADRLTTGRTFTWSGDATGSLSFDGTTNVSAALTLANSGVTAGTYKSVTVDAKGRVTGGNDVITGLITSTSATGVDNVATTNTNTFLNITEKIGTATSTVGSSSQITGAGTVTVASDTNGKITITGSQSITGNAATATRLQTARTINGVAFDGAFNIVAPANRYVIAKDQRALKPTDLDVRSLGFYFTSLGGMNDESNSVYGDLITLNSYGDPSGGKHNALFFHKNTMQILHYQSATYGATTWGTPKTLAYTDGDITGNAATATKLQTARTINGVAFDGTANITIADSTKLPLAGGTMTGPLTTPNINVTSGLFNTDSDHYIDVGKSGVDRMNLGSYNGIFNFYNTNKGTGTEATIGVSIVNDKVTATSFIGSLSGNATTATSLQTARTINGVSFDGTSNITIGDSTKLPLAGGTMTGPLTNNRINLNSFGDNGSGILWYSTSSNTWQDYMASAGSTGNGYSQTITAPTGVLVTGSGRRSLISDVTGYGWTFEVGTFDTTAPTIVAEISSTGESRWSGAMTVVGNITATGNITAFSDARLKDNITKIPDALNKLNQLKGVTYTRKDIASDKKYAGLIAQDVQKVLPEAVATTEGDIIAVDYNGVIGLLVEAIKELESKVTFLENK